jgi:hypothetical protein
MTTHHLVEQGDYSVQINVESSLSYMFVHNGETRIHIPHNTHYSITLYNKTHKCCDCEVTMNHINIGTFRVISNTGWTVERFGDENKKLLFVSGAALRSSNGSLEITFKPEFEEQRDDDDESGADLGGMSMFGSTIKGGYSSQSFTSVKPLQYCDPSKFQKVIFKLVTRTDPFPLQKELTNEGGDY